jgi:hypothetical protein
MRFAQLEREVDLMLSQRDRRMLLPAPSSRQMMVYAERLSGDAIRDAAAIGDRAAMPITLAALALTTARHGGHVSAAATTGENRYLVGSRRKFGPRFRGGRRRQAGNAGVTLSSVQRMP